MKKHVHWIFLCIFLSYIAYEFQFNNNLSTNIAYVDGDIVNVSSESNGVLVKSILKNNLKIDKNLILAQVKDIELSNEESKIKNELLFTETLLIELKKIDNKLNEELELLILKNAEIMEKISIKENIIGTIRNTEYSGSLSLLEKSEQKIRLLEEKNSLKDNQIKIINVQNEITSLNLKRIRIKAEANDLTTSLNHLVAKIERTNIKPPFSGIITEVIKKQGEYLEKSDVIFRMIRQERLWVTAYFSESLANKLVVGKEVKIIIDAFKNEEFLGTIESISPIIGAKHSIIPRNLSTGSFTRISQRIPVRINMKSSDSLKNLKPGYSAKVTLIKR